MPFSKFTAQVTKLFPCNPDFERGLSENQLSLLEIGRALVICLGVKTPCLILLTCATLVLGGCATDEGSNAGEAAKTQEKVPGETNPDAPEAQQQANPAFRF